MVLELVLAVLDVRDLDLVGSLALVINVTIMDVRDMLRPSALSQMTLMVK